MGQRPPIAAPAGLLLVALLLAPAAAGQSSAGRETPFGYSRDPATVIVRFAEIVTAIEDPDPGPSLRVYGDGRVEVHYPRYMLRAGDYTLQLTPAELDDLVGVLVSRGLPEIDIPDVRRRKREREAQSGVFRETSDAVTTEIELNLERYRPRGAAGPDRPVRRRVAWPALRADAKRHPEIGEIRDLAAGQQALLSLMQRSDLVKVE